MIMYGLLRNIRPKIFYYLVSLQTENNYYLFVFILLLSLIFVEIVFLT